MSRTHNNRTSRRHRPRLVIADDDAVVRAVLMAQLHDAFDCVGQAADAAEAIAVVAALHPDVVTLDVNMPHGGAARATRQIGEDSPGTAIVILSVDETRAAMIELLNAGAMTYLRKGIDQSTLIREIVAAIQAHGRGANSSAPMLDASASTAA